MKNFFQTILFVTVVLLSATVLAVVAPTQIPTASDVNIYTSGNFLHVEGNCLAYEPPVGNYIWTINAGVLNSSNKPQEHYFIDAVDNNYNQLFESGRKDINLSLIRYKGVGPYRITFECVDNDTPLKKVSYATPVYVNPFNDPVNAGVVSSVTATPNPADENVLLSVQCQQFPLEGGITSARYALFRMPSALSVPDANGIMKYHTSSSNNRDWNVSTDINTTALLDGNYWAQVTCDNNILNMPSSNGTYFQISHPNQRTYRIEMGIDDNDQYTSDDRNLLLDHNATVIMQVVNDLNMPIPNFHIDVNGPFGLSGSQTANADGNFIVLDFNANQLGDFLIQADYNAPNGTPVRGVLEIHVLNPVPSPTCGNYLDGSSRLVGDINGDHNITFFDVAWINQIAFGNKPSPANICCYDVDHDGNITNSDANLLDKIRLGQYTSPGTCAAPLTPQLVPVCGNNICEATESCSICSTDCGVCSTGGTGGGGGGGGGGSTVFDSINANPSTITLGQTVTLRAYCQTTSSCKIVANGTTIATINQSSSAQNQNWTPTSTGTFTIQLTRTTGTQLASTTVTVNANQTTDTNTVTGDQNNSNGNGNDTNVTVPRFNDGNTNGTNPTDANVNPTNNGPTGFFGLGNNGSILIGLLVLLAIIAGLFIVRRFRGSN